MKKSFFEQRGITWMFAIVALIFGFMFLDSSFTGNTIMNKQSPISAVSLIGLLLIACSAILITYSIKKK